jgi:hypothetical protein
VSSEDFNLWTIPDFSWSYPYRILVKGRVYEVASEGAEAVDITDTLPVAGPCTECDVCDDDAAWDFD